MKKWWLQYAQRIDRMSLRERVLIFAAAALAVTYLIFALAIEPARQREKTLALQIKTQRGEIALLEAQRQPAGATAGDAETLARRDAASRRIEETDEALRMLHQSLVPAQRMNLLLQEVLRGEPGLQLVSLRTLAAAPLLPQAAKTAPPGQSTPAQKGSFVEGNVYKHGVEITVRGGYEDLYKYLARLERSEWRMFWSRARLTTEERPRLTLTLTIHTLSLDKAWLEV